MSKNYFFQGKAYWAKLEEPDQKYKVWTIDLRVDDAAKKMLADSGIQVEIKNDPKEGWEYVRFRRPTQKVIKSELVDFDPPKIVDKDNEDYAKRPLIGNGSDVTCKVLVFDTIKGKGHRLEAVRVDNLIEYIPRTDDDNAPF